MTAFPNYESAAPARPGRCFMTHCDQPAVIELYGAAGPEYGDIRPGDLDQVLAIHPCCSKHAARTRLATDAFGPAPEWTYDRFATATEEVPW